MKSKNKKGFTLIEILAVIVILAIIALIAVPIVMNIITKSQKNAFIDSNGNAKNGYWASTANYSNSSHVGIVYYRGDVSDFRVNSVSDIGVRPA